MGVDRSKYRGVVAALLAGTAVLAASPARAEWSLVDSDSAKLSLGLTAGLGTFNAWDVLGADFNWFEGFVAPSLTGSIAAGKSSFYGGLRVVGSKTLGDGDVTGLTVNEPDQVDVDQAYIGWKSGRIVPDLDEDAIDFSIGRQEFFIGDGFLISDGNFEGSKEGGYWFGPRNAWANSAILRLNTSPLRADVFWLRSDSDLQDGVGRDEIGGVNIEYVQAKTWTVGGSYYSYTQSHNGVEGLDVVSLRAQGNFVPAVPDLFLAGEFAWQEDGGRAARAWYGEVGYTLSNVTWSPKLSYRYSHFSGDDPATASNEAFYNNRYGMRRGWGTWFQGEIAGQYLFGNSNLNAHLLQATAAPLETLAVGANFFVFEMDQAPAGIDDSLGNELDFTADWVATPWLTVSAVYGMFWPGDGFQALSGTNDDLGQLLQLIAIVNF